MADPNKPPNARLSCWTKYISLSTLGTETVAVISISSPVFGEAGSRSSLVRVWSLRLSVTSDRRRGWSPTSSNRWIVEKHQRHWHAPGWSCRCPFIVHVAHSDTLFRWSRVTKPFTGAVLLTRLTWTGSGSWKQHPSRNLSEWPCAPAIEWSDYLTDATMTFNQLVFSWGLGNVVDRARVGLNASSVSCASLTRCSYQSHPISTCFGTTGFILSGCYTVLPRCCGKCHTFSKQSLISSLTWTIARYLQHFAAYFQPKSNTTLVRQVYGFGLLEREPEPKFLRLTAFASQTRYHTCFHFDTSRVFAREFWTKIDDVGCPLTLSISLSLSLARFTANKSQGKNIFFMTCSC